MSLNTKLATAPNTSDTYILKATGSTIGDSIMYQDSGGGMNVAYQGTTGGARIRITPDSPQGYIEAYSGGGSFYKLVLATGGLSVRSGLSTVLMEVTSAGNVGIGTTSPEGVLTVVGTSAQPPTSGTTANSLLQLVGSLNNQLNIGSNTVAGGYGSYIQSSDNNLAVPYPLNLQPNGGVVSIGNTNPQTLFDANVRGMVFGNYSSLSSNSSSGWTSLANNAAQTIGSSEVSGWSYQNTDAAARFALTNGGFAFQVSGTGTSGTAISWTQAMTILNAAGGGKVGIGTSSPTGLLSLSSSNSKQLTISSSEAWTSGTIAEIIGHHAIGISQFRSAVTNGMYFGIVSGNTPAIQTADQSNNAVTLAINPYGGYVGIGKTDPGYFLHVAGAGSNLLAINNTAAGRYIEMDFQRAGANRTEMYWDNDLGRFIIFLNVGTGAYLSGGSWTSISDERLKDIIEPIENALDKLMPLRTVIGNFKNDENKKRKPFLIAQDVQKTFPDAVEYSTLGKDGEEYLHMAYTDMIPLLVKAIQELNQTIQNQQQQINSLINR